MRAFLSLPVRWRRARRCAQLPGPLRAKRRRLQRMDAIRVRDRGLSALQGLFNALRRERNRPMPALGLSSQRDSAPLPACLRFCKPSLVPFDGSKPERGAELGERRSCLVHRDADFMEWSEWDTTQAVRVQLKRVVLIDATAGGFVAAELPSQVKTSYAIFFCAMGASFLLCLALCCSIDPRGKPEDAAAVVTTLDDTTVPPTWVKVESSEQPSEPAS